MYIMDNLQLIMLYPASTEIKIFVYYNSGSIANNDYMLYFQNTSVTNFPSLVAA